MPGMEERMLSGLDVSVQIDSSSLPSGQHGLKFRVKFGDGC